MSEQVSLVRGLVVAASSLAADIRYGEIVLKVHDGRVIHCDLRKSIRCEPLIQTSCPVRAEEMATG